MNSSSESKKISIELPGHRHLAGAIRSFSRRERFIFSILFLVLAISTAGLLWQVNRAYMIEIPAHGGSLTEGVIGIPRFINPVLASSDADRDLTALVYSGLMRIGPDGILIPDLAKDYTESDDGLTYTFTLKNNLKWQDGIPVTADDVVFTINKAQDPSIHSPRRANWEGVRAEKIDDRTIKFTLSQAYAPFLQNTTMGILPKHIWSDSPTSNEFTFNKYNTEPIGSGPFKVKSVSRTNDTPSAYDLVPFKDFILGTPYLNDIRFRFYTDEEKLVAALTSHEVDSINSISPEDAAKLAQDNYRVEHAPLPRVFGVFFNQNQASIFTDKTVRRALDTAIDKQSLINQVLAGYGTLIDGPIPPGTLGFIPAEVSTTTTAKHIAEAQSILADDGWEIASSTNGDVLTKETKKGTETLSFTLSTSAIPELKAVAELLKNEWGMLGAQVDVKVFDTETLNQTVIRPRDYDALLFGEIIGRDSDPFAFWHSSQRLDPGLNIALYANSKADKLLERARTTSDPKEREEIYRQFTQVVVSDIPAVFLYSPDFIYVLPADLKSADTQPITIPSERFANAYQWHTQTQYVWRFLIPDAKRTEKQ